MKMLRDYQIDTLDKLRSSLRAGKRRPVVQMPTGAGKTIMAAAIIKMARENGKRVLFTVPALSLIDQTVERFEGVGIYDIGVIQADHWKTDPSQPVQVASVQTLNRRKIPKVDLVIVDECQISFKMYDQWFKAPLWQKTPIIGLSATPWAKGMGLLWDDLIIGTTIDALIKSGHLCDYKVFAPSHPDLGGVKTKMGDYEVDGLAKEMSRKELVADIVSTWLERGENRQTLCFCVTTAHAKFVQKQFQEAGVKCDYQDAFTSREDRLDIAKRFENGDCQIVCNVGTLTTGVDWDVRCVILARPTKSEILYVQMIGRGLRTAPGKDHLIVLDHSDTTLRLGFVSDIHHDRLSVGQKDVLEKGVKEEPLPKECPQCHYLRPPKVAKCPSCGYQPVPMSQVDSVTGELLELTRGGQAVKPQVSAAEKELFYRELVTYGLLKQYKSGWAWWSYRAKFDEKPESWFSTTAVDVIRPMTASWIKHRQIATAKARAKLNPYPAQARA